MTLSLNDPEDMAYVYPAECLTPGAFLGTMNTAGAQTLFVRGCE